MRDTRLERLEKRFAYRRHPWGLFFDTEQAYEEAKRQAQGAKLGGPLTKVYVGLDVDRI